jgi:2-oxo-4-hydroxy-4-carboxy-5-ureidoimidazoline decarboxylase
MTLAELNRLPEHRAEAEFTRCCGSMRWARLMSGERPFGSAEVLAAVAQRLWWSLAAADWLEAFAAHPRIGEHARSAWAAEEQAGTAAMSDAVRQRLAHLNHEYEGRFGYTFVVSATEKSADDVLHTLERRLLNEPAEELQIAADEERKITGLRLAKLLT